jgi:hypothetical protein
MISKQLLTCAARGEINEALEGLLEAILVGNVQDLITASEKVLTIGETSGLDTMVGILVGSILGIESSNFARSR